MTLFKESTNDQAYLKAGLMGTQGAGKTYTTTLLAIGLIQYMQERKMELGSKPAMFLDTETGSSWIKKDFDSHNIKLYTAKTRAFVDLTAAIKEAEKSASILIIDSISHFWRELTESYMKKRNKARLTFSDWNFLKPEWGKFTDLLVNSKLHIIMCGRLGYEYDYFEDEDGKKELQKTGMKMKAESETGYEPSLLIHMERSMDMDTKKVTRVATILKDRSRLIDGRQFTNPTFKDFIPHIESLNLGGDHVGVDTSRTSDEIIPPRSVGIVSEKTKREIILEKIQAIMVKSYPSQGAADKLARQDLLAKHFKTMSWTEITTYSPEKLEECYKNLEQELKKKNESTQGLEIVNEPFVQP